MGSKLTTWIFVAALVGIAAGWAGHTFSPDAATAASVAGYLAEKGLRREYAAVGDLLSFEPYGIAFARGDAPLAGVVHETFRALASSGEIRTIYNKWFLKTLPSGYRLGVPMGVRLERSFEVLGLPAE
jgi:glutamate/aspartate transport system substrate-binding protein